jgi:hypothetical protein
MRFRIALTGLIEFLRRFRTTEPSKQPLSAIQVTNTQG